MFDLKADLNWSSDWNGYEIGHPNSLVVGLYTLKINPEIHFYIDMENLHVLESWYICENCEANF